MVGLAAADRPGVGEVVDHISEAGGHRLLDRNVHPLPLAGEPLVVHGHQGGRGGVGTGLELGLIEGVLQGLPVVGPEDIHKPAQRVFDDVGSLVVPVWPGLPEVGDRRHDQAGIDLLKGLEVQPQGRHDPGSEVLHQNVGFFDQRLQ